MVSRAEEKGQVGYSQPSSMKVFKINIYEVEHFRWRYIHMIDILRIPMLQSLAT
jgi:hypothetical protein